MISGRDIVCLANGHWEGHTTNKQQIMMRLAKKNRVVFVNRPMSWLSPMSGWDEVPAIRQVRGLWRGCSEVTKNLFVVTPPVVLPLRFRGVPYSINTRIVLSWLKRLSKAMRIERPILWVYQPEAGGIVGRLGEALSIYHCVDDHGAEEAWWRPRATVAAREETLIRAADMVVTTSERLRKMRSRLNASTYFVPNAADFELFSRARDGATQPAGELMALPKPVVGYVGMLHPKLIDTGCIEYLASRSGYSIVFVGRAIGRSDYSRLERIPNVHFLGFQPVGRLPEYLRGMDVCIMPSVRSDLVDSVFPLKLFEYLAAGKPVVATRTEELTPYEHLISLVDTPEEFLTAVRLAVSDNSPARVEARVQAAKANTWDERVEQLSQLVHSHLERGGGREAQC